MAIEDEDKMLKSVALQNANSILAARQRTEQELLETKAELEGKTEELAQSLALVRATLEAATDGILATDGNGKVTGVNQRYAELWNLPREVQERRDHRRFAESCSLQFVDPQKYLNRLEEIYAAAPQESFDVLELADGRIIERTSRIQFVDGQNVGRVWSFRDVTESRKLEEGRLRLAAIVESSDDAIVSKTLEGKITSWNQGAQRMFGYTADEILGKSVTILMPPERVDEEPGIIERLKRGERVDHYETVRKRKDGTLLHVSLTVSPIKDDDGRVVGASKIARDITDRVRTAEERAKLLESERNARLEAERISTMKDEFLANLSHELRTPLNAILGWSQLLASGQMSPDEVKTGIQTIERNARAQTQLIEDLLDMNRIISGKIRLDVQLTDLGRVVHAAIESVRPSAEAKGIRLRAIVDPRAEPVSGDPNRLQQVVWNLLSNAIKFTPKAGRIDVLVQRVNSHLEITVHDSGVGIHPDFLPYVFERFRQADSSTTRKHGGLGLGLSIVKQLVELHGGTVRAESKGEGEGATFTVALPLAPVRQDESREHPSTRRNGTIDCGEFDLKDVKVLVLDDEPDARELIRKVLAHCGAEVILAGTATEALELLKQHKPRVIVSDIGMPEIDGYSFIRSVRGLPSADGGRTPALALTAFARSEDRTRAMIAGYQIHISKPIEPHELLATVASLAGRVE
jgi:PAS domain S-box-containing protein